MSEEITNNCHCSQAKSGAKKFLKSASKIVLRIIFFIFLVVANIIGYYCARNNPLVVMFTTNLKQAYTVVTQFYQIK